jgi:hypothetical protein
MKRIDAKPGERKFIDGRYKDNVDKGAMSFLSIPLPLKPRSQVIQLTMDDTPKQVLRQQQASRHYKKSKNKHRKHENLNIEKRQ